MKLGLGLYKDSLTKDNFQFSQQLGVEALVIHLVDYFKGDNPSISKGGRDGWGNCFNAPLWTQDELNGIVNSAKEYNLEINAIENFNPAHWHDVLLDGPNKNKQLEDIKQLIKIAGKAGIKNIGYNFSLAGVWGWKRKPLARGNGISVGFDYSDSDVVDYDEPIMDGMVWNMVYKEKLGNTPLESITEQELWERLEYFLKSVIPIAEENNVRLSAHPDDPPADSLRGQPRLVNRVEKYNRLLDIMDSPSNGLELCLGSIQEMPDEEGVIYDFVKDFSQRDKIGYIHFRNVIGKFPNYREVFIDEGDINMAKIIKILKETDYQGVLIPDHTPDLNCAAPWHAGMAYALGYMKALIQE